MITRVFISFISLLFLGFLGYNFNGKKDYGKYLESYKDSPGLSLLVYKDGKIIFNKAVGFANYELSLPMKMEHSFAIASISKQFTATAILQLVEKGKISIEDEVNGYFPHVQSQIKIKHLLTHSSGISDIFLEKEFLKVYGLFLSKEKRTEYIFQNLSYHFSPGDKYEYCNVNYTLLSLLIEKISGFSFSEYLQKNIFLPLEMSASWVGASEELKKGRVSGYNINKEKLFVSANYLPFDLDWVLGAGNCYSSTSDLLKWIKGLEKNLILTQQSKNIMLTEIFLNGKEKALNAYGFSIEEKEGHKIYKKSGAINGFQSNLIWIPSKDIIVIGLTNRVDAPPSFVYEIGETLID